VVRALPLSPDDRRKSIIAATIPLLRRHGRAVTTSQIAMAAGVAEGTLFRAFPDKEALISAALETALDPAPFEAELEKIDPALPLRDKLLATVEAMQRRVEHIWSLMAMLGIQLPAARSEAETKMIAKRDEKARTLIAALFAPHRDEIRCEPEQASHMLRAVTFAGSHPRLAEGQPLTAGEIVTLLLDGIRAREED
jgi:AcrR family transcriptional regulator